MRKNYISWDEYFIGVAKLSGERSKDPTTQVGSCIVKDNKIIGIGYNGLPSGCDDDKFPWNKDGGFTESKYAYVVHAEANAILNSTKSLQDATIYVTLFPCNECAKLIIQSGIKEIVYTSDKYSGTDSDIASKRMLEASGVKTRKIKDIEIKIKR